MREEKNLRLQRLKMHEPKLYGYTILGTVFSMIKEEDMSWFYSNLVQVKYSFDMGMFVFQDQLRLYHICPFIRVEPIMFDEEFSKTHNLIETLINFLKEGYFVYIFLDWYHILSEGRHLAHNTLVSGYDLDKEVFYLCDNYDDGKFVTIERSFSSIEKAFFSARSTTVGNKNDNDSLKPFDYLMNIMGFQYCDNVKVEFNKEELVEQLNQYYHSEPFKFYTEDENPYYGFDSYRAIFEHFNGDERVRLERRDFHMLYEHKLLMKERVKFLLENEYIHETALYDLASEICDDFNILRIKYMKCQCCSRERFEIEKESILNQLKLSIEKEKNLVGELIRLLS